MGRQWFPLTMRDPKELARGVAHARPALDEFLDAELARHGLDESACALVGFSQGTMMALHVGPQRKRPLAGILGFSGLLADPAALKSGAVQKPPVLLIHGDRDDLIPVDGGLLGGAGVWRRPGFPSNGTSRQGMPHGIGAGRPRPRPEFPAARAAALTGGERRLGPGTPAFPRQVG